MFALAAVLALAVVAGRSSGDSSASFSAFPRLFRSPHGRAGKRKGSCGFIARHDRSRRGRRPVRRRHASDASRLIGTQPMTKLLRAQSAQLAGDSARLVAAFNAMLDHHGDARSRPCAACTSRRAAPAIMRRRCNTRCAPMRAPPQPGQVRRSSTTARDAATGRAPCDRRTQRLRPADRQADREPLACGHQDRNGRRAMERDPRALVLAQEACRLAPTLVPAAAIYGRLTAQAGDYRRASRIARSRLRPDTPPRPRRRLSACPPRRFVPRPAARARTLARVAPNDPEIDLTLDARRSRRMTDSARARIAPLIASDSPHGRPTRRVCLLMADIEEAEGNHGAVREWLGRAARAPRDKAWVADGVISDHWAPVSPSGALDAFVWRTPDERMAAITEPTPIAADRAPAVPSSLMPPSPLAPSPVEAARARAAPRRRAVERGGCPGREPD